jgi:hypothetical protein
MPQSSRREGFLAVRVSLALCLMLVASGLMGAQASGQNSDSVPNDPDMAAELRALRESLLQTQKQVAAQQREIETLKEREKADPDDSVGKEETPPAGASYAAVDAAGPSAPSAGGIYGGAGAAIQSPPQENGNGNRPLGSFSIGGAEFTPGGFVDLEDIFRTTNTQNNIATNFGAIPFSNTPQGHLTEYRLTGQYSRFNLKVTDKVGDNDVTGYCEADFSGNDATNVYQIVNGHTLRLRLCFMDLQRGKWEVLGGQTWSWMTPNRDGLGPMLSDLELTYNEDQDVQVGLPYTRAAEFRVAYHFNDHWAMGVGIEDPNQFIGGFVALPVAYSTAVSSQFDNSSQIGAPNLFPDILVKIAHDTDVRGRHFHLEATGLVTGVRAGVFPTAGAPFSSHSAVGTGGDIATNYQLFHNFVLLANGFWSDGGAHYLVATGPQAVIRPNAAGTDVAPSLVHAGAGLAGFEWIVNAKTALAVYYGADYYGRNFFPDTTDTAHPDTIIGFGGPGSPNTNNRTVQQPTFDWLQTFWKSDKYGALQYYTQYSYLTRAPWYVASGAPKDAHLSMVYAGFRYILPSTSGTLLRVPYPN